MTACSSLHTVRPRTFGAELLLKIRHKAVLPALLLASFMLFHMAFGENAVTAWPGPTGQMLTGGRLCVDAGNAQEGYFLANVPGGCSRRLKLQVTMQDHSLTYDLNQQGITEVFPFQMGSGEYVISLFENIAGRKYAHAGTVKVAVRLRREDAAFLYPNQYINYRPDSTVIAEAEHLCEGLTNREAYEAVCQYMASGFAYDYVRALTVQAGALPDIDRCMGTRMGICQDLAAVTVAMLRSRGIPARLVIGYAGDRYHAWTLADIEGEELFFDPSAALDAFVSTEEYSAERFY